MASSASRLVRVLQGVPVVRMLQALSGGQARVAMAALAEEKRRTK